MSTENLGPHQQPPHEQNPGTHTDPLSSFRDTDERDGTVSRRGVLLCGAALLTGGLLGSIGGYKAHDIFNGPDTKGHVGNIGDTTSTTKETTRPTTTTTSTRPSSVPTTPRETTGRPGESGTETDGPTNTTTRPGDEGEENPEESTTRKSPTRRSRTTATRSGRDREGRNGRRPTPTTEDPEERGYDEDSHGGDDSEE